jgi:hypothetical protein
MTMGAAINRFFRYPGFVAVMRGTKPSIAMMILSMPDSRPYGVIGGAPVF